METEKYGLVLVLVVLIMLTFAAFLFIFFLVYRSNLLKIFNEKQVAIFAATVEAEEKQKIKIANDLHDEVIHLLTATKREVEKEQFNKDLIKQMVDRCIADLRSIARDLFPKTLSDFGLIHALDQYAMLVCSGTTHKIDIENRTDFDNKSPFSPSKEVNVYRACLEILNNLLKHSGFTYLLISFSNDKNNLMIEFAHDGLGIEDKDIEKFRTTSGGLGLKSLQSRTLILNAKISYSFKGKESFVKLNIPLL